MLSFRASSLLMILKVLLGRKTTRKVSAVEVPFGGSKRKISSGAPKWAIQVKILLNDLFKRIKGTFYLLGLVLSDLKGGRGSTFCVADFALIGGLGGTTAECHFSMRPEPNDPGTSVIGPVGP